MVVMLQVGWSGRNCDGARMGLMPIDGTRVIKADISA